MMMMMMLAAVGGWDIKGWVDHLECCFLIHDNCDLVSNQPYTIIIFVSAFVDELVI
jgi:hypothetical protein